jgi:hypothetical protein
VVAINPKSILKSLQYRQRLEATTPQREVEFIAYVQAQRGLAVIDGYRVTLVNYWLERHASVPSLTLSCSY